jgi:hypothetical protein
LEILRPPFQRSTDMIDSSVSVGMLKNIRPPYRELDAARSPSVGALPHLRDVYELSNKESVTRIEFLWELLAGGRLDYPVVLTSDPSDPDSETLTTATGQSIITASRHGGRTNSIRTEHITPANVTAPLAARGDMLYVATADSNLISLSLTELREPSMAADTLPRGKFTTGGPVEQKPVLTEGGIYAVGERWGLVRLKHGTLEPMWNERLADGRVRAKPNTDAIRVLSVNTSYVYALDRRGRLLVIDAVRGSTLSAFDISAFSFPVTNETNDRLYLASNSGLLLCLHDRLRVRPELLLKAPPPPVKAAEPGPDPKAEVEPKKDPEAKEPKKEPEKK